MDSQRIIDLSSVDSPSRPPPAKRQRIEHEPRTSQEVIDLCQQAELAGLDDVLMSCVRPAPAPAAPSTSHAQRLNQERQLFQAADKQRRLWGEVDGQPQSSGPYRSRMQFAPPSARYRSQRGAPQPPAAPGSAPDPRQPSVQQPNPAESHRLLLRRLAASAEAGPRARASYAPQPAAQERAITSSEAYRLSMADRRVAMGMTDRAARGPRGAPPGYAAASSAAAPPQGSACGEVGDEVLAQRMQQEEDSRLAREMARRQEEEEGHRRLQDRLNALGALEEAAAAAASGSPGLSSDDEDQGMPPSWRRSRNPRHAGPGGRQGWGALALSGMLGLPLMGGMSSMLGAPPFGGSSSSSSPGGPPESSYPHPHPHPYHHRSRHLGSMREMMMGAARSGLPPHLLFSDRDFTADDYEWLCRLDETVENRKGASQTEIDSLPTQVVDSRLPAEDTRCTICLEDICEGTVLRSLPCKHRFHKDCVDNWLKQKAACPICQRSAKP